MRRYKWWRQRWHYGVSSNVRRGDWLIWPWGWDQSWAVWSQWKTDPKSKMTQWMRIVDWVSESSGLSILAICCNVLSSFFMVSVIFAVLHVSFRALTTAVKLLWKFLTLITVRNYTHSTVTSNDLRRPWVTCKIFSSFIHSFITICRDTSRVWNRRRSRQSPGGQLLAK